MKKDEKNLDNLYMDYLQQEFDDIVYDDWGGTTLYTCSGIDIYDVKENGFKLEQNINYNILSFEEFKNKTKK